MATLGIDLSGASATARPRAGPSAASPTWAGGRLRGVLDAPDAPVPSDVLKAAVAVLAAWLWDTRPVAVMGVDSTTHPILITIRWWPVSPSWGGSPTWARCCTVRVAAR